MESDKTIRKCPHCMEEILAEAIRCKHCRSSITPEKPGHQGTCPYCKESIHPDAVKCKHCGSNVGPSRSGEPCEECAGSRSHMLTHVMPARTQIGAHPSLFPAGGEIARARSGCSPCTEDEGSWGGGPGHPHGGIGIRVCWVSVPVLQPNGTIKYIEIAWRENCWTTAGVLAD